MKRTLYVCFITVLLASCSKDNNDNIQISESNFYALTIGNAWVYKNYRYNLNTQNYEDTGIIDSISIIGTENVNGNTYYKFRRLTTGNEEGVTFCNLNGEHFELLRDSIGYLVKADGSVKYANNNFTARPISSENWATIYDELIDLDREITVEAGTFISSYSQRYGILPDGQQSNGLDHFYYADGIGLLYDTSSFLNQDMPLVIRRLDAYNFAE